MDTPDRAAGLADPEIADVSCDDQTIAYTIHIDDQST